jgi:hypothetical protein
MFERAQSAIFVKLQEKICRILHQLILKVKALRSSNIIFLKWPQLHSLITLRNQPLFTAYRRWVTLTHDMSCLGFASGLCHECVVVKRLEATDKNACHSQYAEEHSQKTRSALSPHKLLFIDLQRTRSKV